MRDDSVDYYKIGKLNNYRGLDKGKDWQMYLEESLKMLRVANKQFYIKKGLRDVVSGVELFEHETDPKRYIVRA